MEKEILQYANTTIAEHWQPSVQLRNVHRYLRVDDFHLSSKSQIFLQQLWTSNLGNREWRDIPIETES